MNFLRASDQSKGIPKLSQQAKKPRVVYTCVTSGYDIILEAPRLCDRGKFEFYYFTDGANKKSGTWAFLKIPGYCGSNGKDANRRLKINGYTQFKSRSEITVYLDGNIKLHPKFSLLCDDFIASDSSIALFKHDTRTTIFEEFLACFFYEKISASDFLKGAVKTFRLSERLRRKKVPLFNGGFIIRRSSDIEVDKMMERWWELYSDGPRRDQLHLPLALSDFLNHVYVIPGSISDNEYCQITAHSQSFTKHFFPALLYLILKAIAKILRVRFPF
jgi:hypothetical protein